MKTHMLGFMLLALMGFFVSYSDCVQTATCKCYCSDVCTPRDVKSNDRPFIDEKTGICFCKERDLANYEPNGCHLQPKPQDCELDCCN